jgi:hypothetical protein
MCTVTTVDTPTRSRLHRAGALPTQRKTALQLVNDGISGGTAGRVRGPAPPYQINHRRVLVQNVVWDVWALPAHQDTRDYLTNLE